MADIVITFNTNDKTVAVTVDGQAVDNVVEAYVGKNYGYGENEDEFRCSVSTVAEDKDNKTKMLTRLVAADDRAVAAAGVAASALPGLVVESAQAACTKVVGDIRDFMNSLRR